MTPRTVAIGYREADVLRELLKDGADNETLARRLKLKKATVNHYLKSLYAVTGCPNRTALAIAVLRGDIRPAVRGRDTWHKENAA